jgi:hypothetical protein
MTTDHSTMRKAQVFSVVIIIIIDDDSVIISNYSKERSLYELLNRVCAKRIFLHSIFLHSSCFVFGV